MPSTPRNINTAAVLALTLGARARMPRSIAAAAPLGTEHKVVVDAQMKSMRESMAMMHGTRGMGPPPARR